MNDLLKWSIENSDAARQPTDPNDPSSVPPPSTRGLNAEVLAALFGGPSEAELMKEAMAALLSDEVDLENKLIAFDNFEQLVESIDNANNMEKLGLWTPLIGLLQHKEPDMRRMAAWCVGTAVQNNEKGQDKVSHAVFICVGLLQGQMLIPWHSSLFSTLFRPFSLSLPLIPTPKSAEKPSMLFLPRCAIISLPWTSLSNICLRGMLQRAESTRETWMLWTLSWINSRRTLWSLPEWQIPGTRVEFFRLLAGDTDG